MLPLDPLISLHRGARWAVPGARRPVRLGGTAAAIGTILSAFFSAPAVAQERTPLSATAASSGQPAAKPAAPHPLARWLDVQALAVSVRYRYIEDAQDRERANQLQTQEQIRARFKFDGTGHYSLHAGFLTGGGFTSGWNSTGIGTGEGTATLTLKQLFVAAQPVSGVELQYGGLYPARGENTEITSYDNDAYITAGRATVRRPTDLFFDEVSVSAGYLGYLSEGYLFDRTGSFSRFNYWQALVSKQVGKALWISTDYSEIDEDGRLRQAARWRIDQPILDVIRGEYGVRLRGGSHDTTFAFSGEKLARRVTVQAGYANVDPVFGALNGDRYGRGNRVFTTGSFPLPLDLGASWFVQKEISPPAASTNDIRVDVILTWNVLKTLKRAGALP
jgi:hypothetical protein